MRVLVIAFLFVSGCGDDSGMGVDAGRRDSGVRIDGGGSDAAPPDSAMTDSGTADSGSPLDSGGGGVDACVPITTDPSAIDRDCMREACPTGYTCHDFSGIILQQTCEIICTDDCQCPVGTTCQPRSDKSMMPWMECGT